MQPRSPVAALLSAMAAVGVAGCGGSSTKTADPTATTSARSTDSSTSAVGPANALPACRRVADGADIPPTLCRESTTGFYFRVATENHPLRLEGMRVQFVGERAAPSVSASGGAARVMGRGTFVKITLTVTNISSSPQRVGGHGARRFQLTLVSNPKQFGEAFAAENADKRSFASQRAAPVQPGGSKTGEVIFDLPPSAVANIRVNGLALLVADFGRSLKDPASAPQRAAGLLIIHRGVLHG